MERARYALKSGQQQRLCVGVARVSRGERNGCDCVCCGRCGQLAMRKREPIFICRGVKKAIQPFLRTHAAFASGAKCSPALHLFLELLPPESAPIPSGISYNESLTMRIIGEKRFSRNWKKSYINLKLFLNPALCLWGKVSPAMKQLYFFSICSKEMRLWAIQRVEIF